MSEEQRKILEMLAEGRIGVDDAEKLLGALADQPGGEKTAGETDGRDKPGPRFLRVEVEPGAGSARTDRVNIRIPLRLIRAGLKWASFIPKEAQEKINDSLRKKGMDLDLGTMSREDLDELIENIRDFCVDVEGEEKVRVYCE